MDFGSLKLYIGGALVEAAHGGKKTILCPANEKPIAEVAWADQADALKALKAAQLGFEYWSALSLSERTDWMSKLRSAILENKTRLRLAIIHEMGKTYEGSYEDIEAITNALAFYPKAMADIKDEPIPDPENTHKHLMVHQAAGVAVAYLAWNFPLLNVGFKIGPALASGCSLIIKPSEMSPVSSYILGEILHQINFPPGVINILTGPPEKVATTMTKSKIPSVVTMIGSTQTGKQVIADSSSSIKKLSMELGGNAPFIVFDDANMDAALDLAIGIKFGNCGQICVAANRFFLHENIYDDFLEAYVGRVKKLKLGFGKDSDADMGPLVNRQGQERMMQIVADATAKGAKIETGGKIPDGSQKGYWFEPTVLSNVTTNMLAYQQETFGPIAPIFKFKTEDEVLALANDTEYGLASYLFTEDAERQARFANELQFGEVQINGVKYAIYLPHGGIKNSGIGHDCSALALDDYLIKKRVTTTI
jgi:succinate-semialdehyde dehydrogenase/glutarate-semialdehyde dehydrogenase